MLSYGATVADPPPAPPTADPQRDLLLAWVVNFLPESLSCRSLATGARRAGVAQGRQMASAIASTIADRAIAAHDLGELVDAVHATLVLADVFRRAGAADLADNMVAVAEPLADQTGPIGTAACLLFRGDRQLCPLQSPETLGFDLEAPTAAPDRPDRAARREAAAAYRAALDLYQDAGANRGLGAVALRLAQLARHDADHDGAGRWATQAVDAFTAAGDGAGRTLALTHAAVAALDAGSVVRARLLPVDQIAEWAANLGSQSYAIGCARIVHAWACWAADRGRIDVSLGGFDLATAMTRRLPGAGEFTVDAAEDASHLYARLNSRGVTIAVCEEALAELLASQGGVDAEGPLADVTWLRAANFATTIQLEALAERDPEGLDRSAHTACRLLARAPAAREHRGRRPPTP